jgi:two-component system sensor histidine kinase TctE
MRPARRALSLRLRLFLVILPPLLVVSVLLGWWRFAVAQQTSEELFDRSLLAAALAISRDVAISEGDALSPSTRRFVSDAGGGEVFYHVTAPDGIYVTGYAYPPRPESTAPAGTPQYFLARYRGEWMRVLRLTETRTIDNLTGDAVVTVWQRLGDRQAFARTLASRAAALMAGLMTALALVVWFGVKIGLRPLSDLQEAIRLRSPDDLAPIRRPVPDEVSGVVSVLNRLLTQVRGSIDAHQAFISDAAHQLRNPASALLTLAETLPQLRDPEARATCQRDLIAAARNAARLAEQLLSLERLRYDDGGTAEDFDLNAVVEETCRGLAPAILSRDLDFELDLAPEPLPLRGAPLLLGEALKNLLENALNHGGPGLTRIAVRAARIEGQAAVTVSDDGLGIPPDQAEAAFRRFSQLRNGAGTGLGLAIVAQIAARHHGRVTLDPVPQGACIRLLLPLAGGGAEAGAG